MAIAGKVQHKTQRQNAVLVPWSVWLSAGYMLWDLPTGHFMLQCLHRKVIMNAWC